MLLEMMGEISLLGEDRLGDSEYWGDTKVVISVNGETRR